MRPPASYLGVCDSGSLSLSGHPTVSSQGIDRGAEGPRGWQARRRPLGTPVCWWWAGEGEAFSQGFSDGTMSQLTPRSRAGQGQGRHAGRACRGPLETDDRDPALWRSPQGFMWVLTSGPQGATEGLRLGGGVAWPE